VGKIFFSLAFGFTLGFCAYAVLDGGNAVMGYLPPEARAPLRRAFASVGQAKMPDLQGVKQGSMALVKELIPIEKQLKDAERRHSGEDNPELMGQ
jgi:hypothetical protein